MQDQNEGQADPITFQHAAAESTGLPGSSQDLVSACLLFHELPASAAAQVMAEAFRILRPGGVLAIMVSLCSTDLSIVNVYRQCSINQTTMMHYAWPRTDVRDQMTAVRDQFRTGRTSNAASWRSMYVPCQTLLQVCTLQSLPIVASCTQHLIHTSRVCVRVFAQSSTYS